MKNKLIAVQLSRSELQSFCDSLASSVNDNVEAKYIREDPWEVVAVWKRIARRTYVRSHCQMDTSMGQRPDRAGHLAMRAFHDAEVATLERLLPLLEARESAAA